MRNHLLVAGALAALAMLSAGPALAGHQIGGGIHYLATVGDIKDNPEVDDSNFNFVASYKYTASMISVVADVEFVPDYLGSDEMLYQPQAFLLFGGMIYGGAGVGFGYIDGEWFDDPFYALRAGVDLPLGGIHLDVNANYRFLSTSAFDTIDEQDLDSVTFGAVVRFGL
jgi:hypothetical protein